jgi:hypothetical protein
LVFAFRPWCSCFMLPTVAGMTGTCHHAQLWNGVSVGWYCDSSDLSLQIAWDDRHTIAPLHQRLVEMES